MKILSEILIAPIFALVGTLVGSLIPAISTIISARYNNKHSMLDKHEEFIRTFIIEFIKPAKVILSVITSKSNYIRSVKKEAESIEVFYNEHVKNSCPVELLEVASEIESIIDHIDFLVDVREGVKSETEVKLQKQMNENIKKLKTNLRKLDRKLTRNFL